MRVLTLDIETSPNLAHVWSLWNQNVGLPQLLDASEVMCFAAKWLDEDDTTFSSGHRDGYGAMVHRAHELLSEADVVVTYNGDRFDLPHLNREFLRAGLTPPAPYASVDLLKEVKKTFRFQSNKLDHVAGQLELGGKVKHEGHELWVNCLRGDEEAWRQMETYNRHDVVLTEKLFDRLRPWLRSLPHPGLYDGNDLDGCPACNSGNLVRRGFAHTRLGSYQRYRCEDCGKWSRGGKRVAGVDLRAA